MACSWFVLLLMGAAILLSAMWGAGSTTSRRRASYQRIAQRFVGSYLPRGMFRVPAVLIRHGDFKVTLREVRSWGPYEGRATQVQVDWPEARISLEASPHLVHARSRLFRSPTPILVGDEEFDSLIRIQSHHQEAARSLLSDGVRWQLRRLVGLFGNQGLYFCIYRGKVTVQKPGIYRRFEELEPLVEWSLELFDQMLLTRAEGIEFLDVGVISPLEQVICRVCGEAIAEDLVYCRRCKTPHHLDCWEYNGSCSIFGCRESRYETPRVLDAAKPDGGKP